MSVSWQMVSNDEMLSPTTTVIFFHRQLSRPHLGARPALFPSNDPHDRPTTTDRNCHCRVGAAEVELVTISQALLKLSTSAISVENLLAINGQHLASLTVVELAPSCSVTESSFHEWQVCKVSNNWCNYVNTRLQQPRWHNVQWQWFTRHRYKNTTDVVDGGGFELAEDRSWIRPGSEHIVIRWLPCSWYIVVDAL